MGSERINWKRSRSSLIFFIAMMVGFAYLNAKMMAPYLLSVLMGSILALLSHPLYRKLRARHVSPAIASTLVTLALTVLVIGPLGFFTAMAVKQAISAVQHLSESQDLSFAGIVERLNHWRPLRALVDDPATLERQIRSNLQTGAKTASGVLLGLAGSIPEMLLQGALALLTTFFMLVDGRRFVNWSMEKMPLDPDVQKGVVETFQNTSISVVWATLAASGAQGAVMFLAYLVLGVPAAFLAGGATFVFSWIPVVGSVPVWVAGAVYLYTQDRPGKAIAMVAFGLFTGVIDNFVRPLVLKGRGEMHPLVSLVAIFGGIQWFGIVGVFVGPILTSVLVALLEIWPAIAKRSHLVAVPAEKTAPSDASDAVSIAKKDK